MSDSKRKYPGGKTAKQTVLLAEPKAQADYYETLRGEGKPCWFIRIGLQGRPLSAICSSPRAAWANSANRLMNATKVARPVS